MISFKAKAPWKVTVFIISRKSDALGQKVVEDVSLLITTIRIIIYFKFDRLVGIAVLNVFWAGQLFANKEIQLPQFGFFIEILISGHNPPDCVADGLLNFRMAILFRSIPASTLLSLAAIRSIISLRAL